MPPRPKPDLPNVYITGKLSQDGVSYWNLMGVTYEELTKVGARLGLKPVDLHHPGTAWEHFKLNSVQQKKVKTLGAVEITDKALQELLDMKKKRRAPKTNAACT